MDSYALQHFYNNARKPLAPTTLHSGNISAAAYENVTFIRKLMCRENSPGAHESKFCSHSDYNKENTKKRK
ncbi:unknown [Choristoneura fumiferana multiple nucleopolyhedrovirus]|uniref:Uncharacterized protein n=1 Tax=Choristoneura fumiferana nuclear polyhedrosis virus TaxID=208973 RepID=Q7TLP7_NPVCF|nr:unknown [Choristoneura fumiferana multiple nucleopolyhedrovirus]AAP29884.1 unknown [Choristoneura fumiferana multiple nucleopolyhedrovirus]